LFFSALGVVDALFCHRETDALRPVAKKRRTRPMSCGKTKKRAGFYETNKGGTAANVVPYIETYKGFFLSEIIDL
jgi:hypothetical protein